MRAVIFLLFVAACHGLPLDIPKAPQLLISMPVLKRMETKDDPNNITSHEIVTWSKVESGDPDNPILGYKLKVWEVKKIKKTVYKTQGDKVVRVLEESYPKINRNSTPDGVPTVIVTPANVTTAIFHDMYVEVPYQFAVLAFTAEGDGPLSEPFRITLHNRKEVVKKEDDLLGKKETIYMTARDDLVDLL